MIPSPAADAARGRLLAGGHLIPLAVIVCWALLSAWLAWSVGFEQRWTSDTTDVFYRLVASTFEHPEWSRHAGFATAIQEGWREFLVLPVTQWYQGGFDIFLRTFYLASGDISLAYRVLVFPLNLLAGLAGYLLFFRITGNRWLALALALAALLPMPLSWAGERSGIGPLWTYTRRYFMTACLPLIVWLYLRGISMGRGWVLAAFAVAGLASNLHASGVLLLEMLVLAWLIAGQLTPRRLLQAGAGFAFGLLFSVAALGSLWEQGLKAMLRVTSEAVSGVALATTSIPFLAHAKEIVQPSLQYLFYPPRIYEGLPGWLIDVWLVLTILASLLPLLVRRRQGGEHAGALFWAAAACLLFISFEQMWCWVLLAGCLFYGGRMQSPQAPMVAACYLIVATFWISVVGMLAFQIGHAAVDGFPLVYNQLRGIRFMGFWVFLWLATLAGPWLAGYTDLRGWRRWGVYAALMLVLLSFGKTLARQYQGPDSGDRPVQKIALLDVARWAREHTPADSVFLLGYSSFGVVAERRIVFIDKVVRDQRIGWLPPRDQPDPAETMRRAESLAFTHLLFDARSLDGRLTACVLYRNSLYALSTRTCAAAALMPAAAR